MRLDCFLHPRRNCLHKLYDKEWLFLEFVGFHPPHILIFLSFLEYALLYLTLFNKDIEDILHLTIFMRQGFWMKLYGIMGRDSCSMASIMPSGALATTLKCGAKSLMADDENYSHKLHHLN